jgi:hypothetical protein
MATRAEMIAGVRAGVGYRAAANLPDPVLQSMFVRMREARKILTPSRITTVEQAAYLRQLIQKYSPVDTGALRASWSDPRTVQILPDGGVEIDNPLPYARIQDLGGVIHRTTKDGRPYTIRIPAQHYVAKAVREYQASPMGAEAPITGPVEMAGGGVSIAGLIGRGIALVQLMRQAKQT